MFGRLAQKELLHHLLDFRFIAVFVLCTLLSGLSVYVGTRTYLRQVQEYHTASERNQRGIKRSVENNSHFHFSYYGYAWGRRPEVLSPVVYGLSGNLGQEVHIHHRRLFQFEKSLFSTDPIQALFGILDFSFIVKVILSLCVLLLTYDAVCGEKEAGTLRLYASFPVSRSSVAMAKLVGSTIAVLVPFAFSFLLASTVLALSPELGLRAEDWGRMAALLIIFVPYLMVFAAFGLWGSALTQRRLTSFLGLLGLWTVWIFIVPNLAMRAAQSLVPVESIYEQKRQTNKAIWEMQAEFSAEGEALSARFGRRHGLTWPEGFSSMSKELRREWELFSRKDQAKLETEYYPRLRGLLMEERRNQVRRKQNLTVSLSAISPLGAVSFASMDLARTGIFQKEQLENALDDYHLYLGRFLREKLSMDEVVLADFSLFNYRDTDTLSECLSRNAFHILNLLLLAILGFAGAYVAILRYDVR